MLARIGYEVDNETKVSRRRINSCHVMNVAIHFQCMKHKFESKIKDSVETTDNPFENESTFLSTDSRATQRRKGKKPRSKRFKTDENDPEIEAEQKRYGSDNVRIIQ